MCDIRELIEKNVTICASGIHRKCIQQKGYAMNLDLPAQRLLINALRLQIEVWQKQAASSEVNEDDRIDLENDIGFAFTLLSSMKEAFFEEAGVYPE